VYGIPSGKHTKNYGKSPFSMGKSTISTVIFNSDVTNYQSVTDFLGEVEEQSLPAMCPGSRSPSVEEKEMPQWRRLLPGPRSGAHTWRPETHQPTPSRRPSLVS